MDEELKETNQSNRPNGNDEIPREFVWMFCAFLPGLVAILCLEFKNPPQWLWGSLLLLNVLCSLSSGIGLLAKMKDQALQFIFGVLLAGLFFVLNVVIVIFVGCSGTGGRIA